jgi:hypothetical protein
VSGNDATDKYRCYERVIEQHYWHCVKSHKGISIHFIKILFISNQNYTFYELI